MGRFSGRLVTADFFTHSYRISAQVNVRGRTLLETLNDRLTSYLELQDAYVSRISKPGEIIGTYNFASLRKDGISFVLLSTPDTEVTERPVYTYFTKRPYLVFVTVPSFEIKGKLLAPAKLDLQVYLVKEAENFLTLSEAQAVVTEMPQISFSGVTFFVNKARIELFGVAGRAD